MDLVVRHIAVNVVAGTQRVTHTTVIVQAAVHPDTKEMYAQLPVIPENMDGDAHQNAVSVVMGKQRATLTTVTVRMDVLLGSKERHVKHVRRNVVISCDPEDDGAECTLRCGQCRDGNMTCNTNNGYCPHGCSSGYKGQLCNIPCASGEFGPNCTSNCGYCHDGSTTCDTYNGHCPDGCVVGYKGDFCNTTCEDGAFGKDCIHYCAFCINGDCNTLDGTCRSGCLRGYMGQFCNESLYDDKNQDKYQSTPKENIAAVVVAAVSSTLLFGAIISNVVFIYLYCRRKARYRNGTEKTDTNYYTTPGPSVSSDYDSLDMTELGSTPGTRR
ncbi:protein draper-like [Mya arenaria]|uniref:protein draper-like n=1 Tax=Mya arenaria TaxID=6604 RepID=UPI0022E3BA90|nr:protein draper-like [Mya arenaria]